MNTKPPGHCPVTAKKKSEQESKVPRTRPSCRLQALTGETPAAANDGSQQTAEDHFRVTVYYTSIDKVVSELQSRFQGNSPGGFVRIARIQNVIML